MHKSNRFFTWVTCNERKKKKMVKFRCSKVNMCSRMWKIFTPKLTVAWIHAVLNTCTKHPCSHKAAKEDEATRDESQKDSNIFIKRSRGRNLYEKDAHDVPARYVAAPHFVALAVIHNVLLNLVKFLGENEVLVVAPTRQTNSHARRCGASFVGQQRSPDGAVSVEWSFNFYYSHIEILQSALINVYWCLRIIIRNFVHFCWINI